MRVLIFFLLSVPLLSVNVIADDDPVLVSRGSAELTLFDLDARVSRLAEVERPRLAEQHQTLANMMSRLLLNRQLANEARQLGLDNDPLVQRDLQHAMEEVLAVHRMNALVSLDSLPDFELLAHEHYLADPSQYTVPRTINVRHILIAVDEGDEPAETGEGDASERLDDAAALAKAREVLAMARQPGADFVALMKEYSDDGGSAQSGRVYTLDRPGQFVPEFEAAAEELTEPGEISEPVRSQYGYHLIQLESRQDSYIADFEAVKLSLIESVRQDYLSQTREAHRRKLASEPETGNEELLRSLPERYGAPVQAAAAQADQAD